MQLSKVVVWSSSKGFDIARCWCLESTGADRNVISLWLRLRGAPLWYPGKKAASFCEIVTVVVVSIMKGLGGCIWLLLKSTRSFFSGAASYYCIIDIESIELYGF